MGYFADSPRTFYKVLNRGINNVKRFGNIADNTLTEFFRNKAPEAWKTIRDATRPRISFQHDSCNFNFSYSGQATSLISVYFSQLRIPGFSISIRNSHCQILRPTKKPSPLPKSFYVGDECNCAINVTFAFFVDTFNHAYGKPTISGGGGLLQGWLKGEDTPGLILDSISGTSNNLGDGIDASGQFENYDKSNIIKGRSGGILSSDGETYLSYNSIFFRRIEFSYQEVQAGNGWVTPVFPKFIYEYSIDPYQPRIQEIIEAPWQVVTIGCIGCQPNKYIDPPPPLKEKECSCMCCPEQENLLKLILKRIGSLPADIPTSFLTKNGVQPAQLKKVESLTEFIAWFAERFDETLGEFEITIEVDDADLTKEGQQKQTIRLPNLAESIAEMFSLMIHSNINNELILNIVNRTLIESGQIKQSEFKTYSALNALIEYVGFHTSSQIEKMPLSFTTGEKSFDKFLKESEQNVSVLVYEQKETLTAIMQSLLQAAAITRAVHYRRTSGNQQNFASTVKEDLSKLLGETGNITNQIKTFIANMDKVYDGVDSKPN